MNSSEQSRFDSLYQQHLNVLRLQGLTDPTIDAYSRAVRRVSAFFDCCPNQLNQQQLRDYFYSLVQSHSWSTVKLDRNGLQFFYRHILNKSWQWVDIIAYRDIGKGRELGAEASNHPRLKPYPISYRSRRLQTSSMVRAKRVTKPFFCVSTAWACVSARRLI